MTPLGCPDFVALGLKTKISRMTCIWMFGLQSFVCVCVFHAIFGATLVRDTWNWPEGQQSVTLDHLRNVYQGSSEECLDHSFIGKLWSERSEPYLDTLDKSNCRQSLNSKPPVRILSFPSLARPHAMHISRGAFSSKTVAMYFSLLKSRTGKRAKQSTP